jgi:molybdopterin/thiamine biosynthesis adenylyltransferase
LTDSDISVIGAGAIGSFAALTLAKMGARTITVYDEDGVEDHNLPNQFYRKQDIKQFKVEALSQILAEFSDTRVRAINKPYVNQILRNTVVVATDSMASRKLVWEQFLKQNKSQNLIEARMGAELGMVYTIKKGNTKFTKHDIPFYQDRLYTDDKVKPLPCTGRSIIYNILMISSLICRAYKSVLTKEKFPRELIFNMTSLDERSYMMQI